MDTAEIEVFLTLAEELHFGRTAERLRMPQPRVSRLVSAQPGVPVLVPPARWKVALLSAVGIVPMLEAVSYVLAPPVQRPGLGAAADLGRPRYSPHAIRRDAPPHPGRAALALPAPARAEPAPPGSPLR
jgi:hypothetical protein